MKAIQSKLAKHSAGFTLIEILAVIFIVGIVVSAATLAFGDNQAERLQRKSLQLAALVEMAKEQAIFNSQELGILFTKDSYDFYSLSTGRDRDNKNVSVWSPLEQDRILNKRTLPDGLEYELSLEGVKVNFSASNLKDITPHVFILSDGTVSPFEINITTGNSDHTLAMTFAENGDYELVETN